ncbi:hypothetical protein WN944_018302 [Citrus x changshan-huyou]|uniref:Uncharacterized protein n=1 Tax=Citrus x changshan-huyou TaxID=2935761 RepID=A0AAP0LTU3_9ROSI
MCEAAHKCSRGIARTQMRARHEHADGQRASVRSGRENKARERERAAKPDPKTRLEPAKAPGCISDFRPPHRRQEVPIELPRASDHFPTILTTGKWPEAAVRNRDQPLQTVTSFCRDFAGFRPCRCLDLVPHGCYFKLRPATATRSCGLDPVQPLEFSWLSRPIYRRGRASKHTAATVGFSEARSFYSDLPGHRRKNSGHRWSARAF